MTNINLDLYVKGGQSPYTYEETSGLLAPRGYFIQNNVISGTASEYGFEEANGTIKVTDSMGQTLNLPYKVGKITGKLFYNPSAAEVLASIPAGNHSATVTSPGTRINLKPGVSGGTGNYTVQENVNNGWSAHGFEVQFDANLKATKIVYPNEAKNAGSFDVDITDGNATVTATV